MKMKLVVRIAVCISIFLCGYFASHFSAQYDVLEAASAASGRRYNRYYANVYHVSDNMAMAANRNWDQVRISGLPQKVLARGVYSTGVISGVLVVFMNQ